MAQGHQKNIAGPCIWMQAGVVKARSCHRDFNCNGCRFDRILRQIAEENRRRAAAGRPAGGRRGRIVYWADKLKELPVHRRPCLHHLKQRIGFRSCTNGYICSNCEFDQYFQDQYTIHAVMKPIEMKDIQGVKLPQGVYLHPGHAWVGLAAGGQVRIGLDAFASRLLGTMDGVDLPLMGKAIQRDTAEIHMHRGDLDAGLLAPVSGVVTAFNPKVTADPATLAADPYGSGWLLMVQPTDLRGDLRTLQIGDEAATFVESEIDALYAALESELGPLAADGGNLAQDILGQLPPSCWQTITRQFLKT
jgi:glycine cleavage system H lipoate-binding protein